MRAKTPAELEADERFAPAPLAFAAELSALPWESLQLDRLGLSHEQRAAYREALESDEEPIHRMLGHPDAVQDDPRAGQDDACLLLQVDSDDGVEMMWGDVGRLYLPDRAPRPRRAPLRPLPARLSVLLTDRMSPSATTPRAGVLHAAALRRSRLPACECLLDGPLGSGMALARRP